MWYYLVMVNVSLPIFKAGGIENGLEPVLPILVYMLTGPTLLTASGPTDPLPSTEPSNGTDTTSSLIFPE